jgi:hypothetical protein
VSETKSERAPTILTVFVPVVPPPSVELGRSVQRDKASCFHQRSVVDRQARTVECKDCHTPLDPFVVLHRLAQDMSAWQHARDEKKKLDLEIVALKAEVKRLKDQRRRVLPA